MVGEVSDLIGPVPPFALRKTDLAVGAHRPQVSVVAGDVIDIGSAIQGMESAR